MKREILLIHPFT